MRLLHAGDGSNGCECIGEIDFHTKVNQDIGREHRAPPEFDYCGENTVQPLAMQTCAPFYLSPQYLLGQAN